jgi:hypothetical protein
MKPSTKFRTTNPSVLIFSKREMTLPLRNFVSAVLSAVAVLLLISAALPVFARDPGPSGIGWTGTYAIDEPAGLTYYQVSAAFSGHPPNPNMLSGAGVVAQCIHPPNPNTPYTCDTDPSTLESFDATGALTIDPTTGQTTFTWVVKDPGPAGLPGGSTFVSVFRDPGPGSYSGIFTLTFPSELQVTGNFLAVVRSR